MKGKAEDKEENDSLPMKSEGISCGNKGGNAKAQQNSTDKANGSRPQAGENRLKILIKAKLFYDSDQKENDEERGECQKNSGSDSAGDPGRKIAHIGCHIDTDWAGG